MKAAVAPPVLAGEKHISLGITEPGGGSDVASLRTTAVRDGDHFVVNGSKTYITGGMRADWVSTAVRTGGEGAGGVSMLLIPTDAGLSRARRWTASRDGGPRIRPPCISITCACPWKT
jgi:acyl-CoA dehydrogenase